MRKMRMEIGRRLRAATLTAAVGVSAALAGCDNFMEVSNPGAIEPPALESPDYINLMVAGVIGDFQPAFAWTALFSGAFADELRNHHGFFENGEIDRRDISPTNGTYAAAVYNGLHRSRFLADSVAGRLRTMLADSAGRDLRLARVLAYSGYSWTLLGEQMCETPINESAPVPSDKLLESAIQRFDEAIKVATAARAAAGSVADAKARAARVAGADSIINLARVGAARAALNLAAYNPSARQRAVQYASAVAPGYASEAKPGFEFRAHYMKGASFSERRRISNPFWEFVTAGRWFSISDTPFEDMADPRVPRPSTLARVADATMQPIPNSPTAFSTYTGTAEGAPFDPGSNIRVASALEARYILAEAQGLNAANLAFINQRRAVGGQAPLPSAATQGEYLAALRDQRRRDLYLDSHRLGDLRRYKKMYGVDEFPKGAYPGSKTLTYGSQECLPIPISDR
jgi:hypothetical protein